MDCDHYDNWCEKEKRTCNNCYYERGDNMEEIFENIKEEYDKLVKEANEFIKKINEEE